MAERGGIGPCRLRRWHCGASGVARAGIMVAREGFAVWHRGWGHLSASRDRDPSYLGPIST